MKKELCKDGIRIKSYFDIYHDITLISDKKILLDSNRVNYNIYSSLKDKNEIIVKSNYSQMMKVVKNKTEIKNMKLAHIKDAVAMVKFIYYVKHTKDKMTE